MILLKILQINSVCGNGSTGRIATDLYNIIEEEGYESVIAYGRNDASQEINTIKIGTNFDNYMHVAKTRISDKHGFGSTKATITFINQIKDYDPDIIHLHNIHGYYLNIEILFNYLRESNKPIVWTLHDCWAFTGHCAYYSMIKCTRWKTECHDCPLKNKYPASKFADNSRWNYLRKKELFTSLDNLFLVTPSEWLANEVKLSYLSEYPLTVINNGIDLKAFRPTENDFKLNYNIEDKFIILGVASFWDERKGLATFVELSEKLNEDFQIILVGLTDNQKKAIPRNILCISKTNSIKELADIYSAADIFINPSREETMGLVTVEALACGTPAIVYNATAIPEVIDSTCGFVIEENNVNDLIEAIKKCKVKNFIKNDCLNRAKMYEKADKFKEYIRLYKNIKGVNI